MRSKAIYQSLIPPCLSPNHTRSTHTHTPLRPGLLDFTGRRKHGAWEKQKGKDKAAAMEAYIVEVERQISTYGTKA